MRRAPRRNADLPPIDLALRWLSVRSRTESELRTRLRRAEVAPEAIEAVIGKLRTLGYLDDARFARSRAAFLVGSGRFGPRAAAGKLALAGVPKPLVAEAVAEAMEGKSELDLAVALLEKRHPGALGSSDPKLRAKAARFLVGRGFSPRAAFSALGRGRR